MKNKINKAEMGQFIVKFKRNLSQISALINLSLKLKFRFKYVTLISYITPIFGLLTSFFIMNKFFELNINFGSWTKENLFFYLFTGYVIFIITKIAHNIPSQFLREKMWETISALIIAPINKLNWLLGIYFSEVIQISIPLILTIILCFLFYPVSIITILLIVGVYILIFFIFTGIGFIIGIFAISNENIWHFLDFLLTLIIWLSCITFPFKVFPIGLQIIINLNPFYHIVNILRLAWIENSLTYTLNKHIYEFIILTICSILFPCIGVYLFNKIYKKYGIIE